MSHDTVIHRFIRPAVRVAARTRLTPNQVTTLRLITGLAAAWIFAQGSYGWMVLGGAVFLFSMLLDRADGELARQTGQMSMFGYRYDLLADCAASIATFIGLGCGIEHTAGMDGRWFGALAGIGIGVLFFELNVLKVASVGGHRFFNGRIIVDPDDAMIFVPILIWCGLATPMLIIAAISTPVAAIWVGVTTFHRRYADNRNIRPQIELSLKPRR